MGIRLGGGGGGGGGALAHAQACQPVTAKTLEIY